MQRLHPIRPVKKRFPAVFRIHGPELPVFRRRAYILQQVKIPGIIHMPVQIAPGKRHHKVRLHPRSGTPDQIRKRERRLVRILFDDDSVFFREDRTSCLRTAQHPQRAALRQLLARCRRRQAVKSRKKQMPHSARPGCRCHFLVVLRQPVKIKMLLSDHPEQPSVKCLLAAEPECCRVRNRALLHDFHKAGGPEAPVAVHIPALQPKRLRVHHLAGSI